MRVLYITSGFPYPLTSGYLRHYHLIRGLSENHQVRLLSIVGRTFRSEHLAAMAPYTSQVLTFGSAARPSKLRRAIRNAGTLAGNVDGPVRRLREAVMRSLRELPADVVVFSGKRTYPAIAGLRGVPLIVDMCDATSVRIRGRMRHSPIGVRPALWLQVQGVRSVERRLAHLADHLVFASRRDREAIAGSPSAHASVIPNGIDLETWTRRSTERGANTMILTGAMDYPPNLDAALHLIETLYPQVRREIPEARLLIVGRDPPPRLINAGRRFGAQVTGSVPDIRPYLEEASVFVAPLRYGAGIQNKVLEAMAMGVPVVTSPIAADGLRTDEGHEAPIVVARDPRDFVDRILAELRRARTDRAPDRAGREYVQRHFVWSRSTARLERAMESIVPVRGDRARVATASAPAAALDRRPERTHGGRASALTVALIGPDGVGKTTIGRRLQGILPVPVKYIYMGVNDQASNVLLPTTRFIRAIRRWRGGGVNGGSPGPVRRAARPAPGLRGTLREARSLLRIGNRIAEEWYRQAHAAYHVRRGRVVLFDRHFLADYYAHDMAQGNGDLPLSRRLHGWMLRRWYPQPDLVVLLDAPVELLWERKQEGSFEVLAERRREYLRLRDGLDGVETVDASQPQDVVVEQVAGLIRARLAAGRRGA